MAGEFLLIKILIYLSTSILWRATSWKWIFILNKIGL
jgi:hypothetical protein